jgi:Zn-dependent peptidase ImmA (M78 family)
MDIQNEPNSTREAALIPSREGLGKNGQILYNPLRPSGRVLFSIAHEIAHSFFPNTTTGARFRDLHSSDSPEANELERLCDLAASELVMPLEDFQDAAEGRFCLESGPEICDRFGSSSESTVFRLASAHPGIAVAGMLRYRLSKSEQASQNARAIQLRFRDSHEFPVEAPQPKYRQRPPTFSIVTRTPFSPLVVTRLH